MLALKILLPCALPSSLSYPSRRPLSLFSTVCPLLSNTCCTGRIVRSNYDRDFPLASDPVENGMVHETVAQLLLPDATKRFGSESNRLSNVRRILWLNDFDWTAMERRELEAPLTVPSKDSRDLVFDTVIPPYTNEGSDFEREWAEEF